MTNKDWETYESKIEKRINSLLKNNFYFEIIFLFGNILEAELKHLIDEHQKACRYILDREKIKFYPKNIFNSDKKTLGELKEYTASFIKDRSILEEMRNFNKLRIKTIHKLFNQNLKNLEQEIKKFIPSFHGLMEKLIDIRISIIVSTQKYKTRELIHKYKKSHETTR